MTNYSDSDLANMPVHTYISTCDKNTIYFKDIGFHVAKDSNP